MVKTIIINRLVSASELDEITRQKENGAEIFSISGKNQLPFAEQLTLDLEEKREINYSIMSEVLRFGDLEIGSKTFSELFYFGSASIWHYHKFRIYFAVRNLMYFLSPVQKKFDSFTGHLWFVSEEIKPLQRLFPDVEFRFSPAKKKEPVNFWHLFGYATLIKIRFIKQWFKPRPTPEYLLYLTEKYSSVLDRDSLKIRKGHHVLEYLINSLDKRFMLLTEVLMPKVKGKSDYSFSSKYLETHWNGFPKIFAEKFLISGFLKASVRKEIKQAQTQLKQKYAQVQDVDFSLLQKIIFEVFQSLHKSSVYFLSRYYASFEFFANSGLKAIIASDENSPLTKSILDAAKVHGIKVIGLQHGTMHDLHPAYLFTENDHKNRIMPDLTLTWGKYWEEFLITKGNYSADSVISVGQIRTDIIPILLKAELQQKTTNTVVFASQPQRDPELRRQAAWDVFTAVGNTPDVRLVVKLHPREIDDADYYSEIAKQAGCSNFVIDKASDLYELISSCDVLITCFSTVGTETVYFHKPLIILDHLRQDIQGYAAEGVAFQATDARSLSLILSGIFAGTLKINQEKYDAFIQKYAFRIDGKVAERCIKAITSAT